MAEIIYVVLELSNIFKGVILRNFISKISNLMYVFIYCNSLSTVQWRFCCHSAAVCDSADIWTGTVSFVLDLK